MEYIGPMFTLLRTLLGRLSSPPLDPRIESLVARAVEQIDPRLKSFSNYPCAYRPAIIMAMQYAKQLAASLPEPIDLSPSRFAQQPLLHALFTSTEGIYCTVRESQEIKNYCREHGKPAGGELFALMGMRRREKTVFGRELSGDMVQPDVQQTMIYFEAHTLMLPTTNRDEFRSRLETHLFDSLIKSLRDQIAQAVAQRHELEVERDIIAAHRHSAGGREGGVEEKLQAIRRQLKTLDEEYSLGNYSALMNQFFDEREQYLRLEQKELPIDMRGVMRDSKGRLAGRFVFYDLVGRDRRRWTLCPVRLPVEELQQAMHCGSEKERWMEF